MKKNVLILLCVFFALSSIYVGYRAYDLLSDDIHGVLLSMDNPDYPSGMVEYYLFNYRGNKEDIVSMEQVAGLTVLFNKDFGFADKEDKVSEDTKKYVEFFLSKGFNINAIDNTGYNSLHHAIILNRTDVVRYLLEKGADPKATVGSHPHVFLPVSNSAEDTFRQVEIAGLNALELAQYVAKKNGKDLSGIIEVLKQ